MIKKTIALTISLSVCSSLALANIADCHPPVDAHQSQYLVGYGSLMAKQSKDRTVKHTGANLPVMIKGFKRAWMTQSHFPGFKTTFLGVSEHQSARLNAVIFKLPNAATSIHAYDSRENPYCRRQIKPSNITLLTNTAAPAGQIWIYTTQPHRMKQPDTVHPITQSYVDLFLTGCIEQQAQYHLKHFIEQCITTTSAWSKYWVNDRIYPRYPSTHQPYAIKIDQLLRHYLPQQFKQIQIE